MKLNFGNSAVDLVLFRQLFMAVLASFILAGCSSPPKVASKPQVTLESLMKEADAELIMGKREQAVAVLNRAAQENPTSMEPWLKIANIWFIAANYPSSILAANEVIKRDTKNQEARSILVVAGLRVAADAVTGLLLKNPETHSARTEAENLTKTLRVALGENILVPPTTTNAVATPTPVAAPAPKTRKYIPRTYTPVVHSAAPVETSNNSVSSSGSGGSDPFKSLK